MAAVIAAVLVIRLVLGTDSKGKPTTSVGLWLGDQLVATATLGGRYTESQVSKELRRQPQRFKATGEASVPVLLNSFPLSA